MTKRVDIPKQMRAVVQSSQGGKLEVKMVDVPVPGNGQVLVKMEYSSINPSDLSMLQGTYVNEPKYPVIPGIEGSGTVVAVGSGIIPAVRMGKIVSCTSSADLGGTWAEYVLTSAMHVIPAPESIDFKQASSLIVNPLTALAFVDIMTKHKTNAIVNNAAGGALGKMLVALSQKENFDLVSIVRNENQVKALKELGAKYVLDSNEPNYIENLQKLVKKLNIKLFFDALGGKSTNDFIQTGLEGSTVYLYANLSEEKSFFDTRVLLQQQKEVKGFYLGNYSSNQGIIKTLKRIKKAHNLLKNELRTNIAKTVELENVEEGIKFYKNNMSQGKVLVKCGE
jgi:NADPH:quinone reductase-like Zn-dependent oxidoreductase